MSERKPESTNAGETVEAHGNISLEDIPVFNRYDNSSDEHETELAEEEARVLRYNYGLPGETPRDRTKRVWGELGLALEKILAGKIAKEDDAGEAVDVDAIANYLRNRQSPFQNGIKKPKFIPSSIPGTGSPLSPAEKGLLALSRLMSAAHHLAAADQDFARFPDAADRQHLNNLRHAEQDIQLSQE